MSNTINSTISSKLQKLISSRKLKDSDVLRRCNITRPTLIKIKNGGNINVETLAALANGLSVKITYFLDEETAEKDVDNENKSSAPQIVDVEAISCQDECVVLHKRIYNLQQQLIEAQRLIIELQKRNGCP